MDSLNVVMTAAAGVVASAVTAYVTVRINSRQERKRFERELAAKLAEVRLPTDDVTHAIAVQFAEGVLTVERRGATERDRVFLPSGCRVTLGRDKTNHIVVDSPLVSQTHMGFVVRDSQVWLEAFGTNPVKLNGHLVDRTSTRLREGDTVTIADPPEVSITFRKLRA